jgi:hypothetical protein
MTGEAAERSPHRSMTTAHRQIRIDGIDVDEAIAPLLSELWGRGLRTQFSCQGSWSGPKYTPGMGTKEGPLGTEPWLFEDEEVDSASYILFDRIEDAAYFLWVTTQLLVGATGPEDRILHDAQLKLEPGDAYNSRGIRGCVRFHAALLNTITRLWSMPLTFATQ